MTAPARAGNVGRSLAIVASVVVVATIVASVIVTGTPAQQREVHLDAQRVIDLQKIGEAIDRHVEQAGALPASLAELAATPGVRLAIVDPVTASPYDFQATSGRTYRLCASFTTDTAKTPAPAGYGYGHDDTEWAHGAGRRCFDRTVEDPGK